MNRIILTLLAGLTVSGIPQTALARIKLATLPARERVELQLDNGRFTLVEEERIVPLLKSTVQTGNNMIDFSWSNTTIDKDSIQFRPIAFRSGDDWQPIGKDQGALSVNVINVAYPPNENSLVWEVYAAEAGVVKVRVSYLIHNLTRTFNYRALANKEETQLTLRSFISLSNYSGEEFGDAGVWAGFGPKFIKQVGQQEEIKMLIKRFPDVPIVKTFTYDWYAHGQLNPDKPFASPILMHYVLTNDEENRLGAFPLQPGKVRIFVEDGRGGEAFLGEDVSQLTPLDDKMRLYLGQSRDIVCNRTIEKNVRHAVRGNLHHQELIIKYEIENFRDKPARLDIVEQLNRVCQQFAGDPHGDVEWERGAQTSQQITFDDEFGHATPVLRVELPPRPKNADQKVEKTTVRFHFTLNNVW